ncbi:tyrosine-type recombinase/integrase [Kitasatospora sp. NPDC054939]
MGSFFKECEHPEPRWSRCSHDYKIRYRNASGQQTEESGFANQDLAKARLAEVYHARKNSPMSLHKAERIRKYGSMQFSAYAAEWLRGRRHQSPTSLRNTDSILRNHLLPALGSRRMTTFDHKVVEAVITDMERNGTGLAAQKNALSD